MTVDIQKENSGSEVIPTILRMLELFDARGIRYVHWKSNTNIAQALSGVDDFDMLVHPQDQAACEEVLRSLSIIRANSRKDAWQSNVFHFVGADAETCKLVHVHVHYALPIGFDYDKNFVLPVVDDYLATRWKLDQVFLPEVEMEYAILVVRLIVKHGLDTFLLKPPHRQLHALLGGGKTVVGGGGYAEFLDLAGKVDRRRLDEIVGTTFSFVGSDVFERCEQALQRNRHWSDYFGAARALKRKLRTTATHGPVGSFLRAGWRLNKDRLLRLLRRRTAKTPVTGGRMIAFVGGDGAGKSTNVESLARTLAREFDVATVHVGRPPTSWRGGLLRVLARLSRAFGRREFAQALIHLRIAFDRAAAFRKAKRLRGDGTLVILDRLPLRGLTRMDCPRIHLLGNGRYARLAAIERRQYENFDGADCLIVLKLDPEVALKRRPEDDPEELRARSGEIWNDAWDAPYAHVVDTGAAGVEGVRREVLVVAWAVISRPYYLVEILGLSGVGKSTVTSQLLRKMPNVRAVMPYRAFKWRSLLGALRGLGVGMRILVRTGNLNAAKNGPFFFASLQILEGVANRRNTDGNFLFDQGPVFQRALALKENALALSQDARSRRILSGMTRVFILEVSDEELFSRVRSRGKSVGRANMIEDFAEFKQFCEEYRVALEAACDSVPEIVRIDALDPVTDIVDRIVRELEQP